MAFVASDTHSDTSAKDWIPFIGHDETKLFGQPDTRLRADQIQQIIVPRLRALLDLTRLEVLDVYGASCLRPYRVVSKPAHRPEAHKTLAIDAASVGIAVKGEHWYFQQSFECNSDGLRVKTFGLRGREANPILQVMKSHTAPVTELLTVDQFMVHSGSRTYLDVGKFIRDGKTSPERQWNKIEITSPLIGAPLDDVGAAKPAITWFVTLFPLFRAATDVLRAEQEHFQDYWRLFLKWHDARGSGELSELDEDEGVVEGRETWAMRRHRAREAVLRRQKIEQALEAGKGHLKCEVPGCGFDFLAVYGSVGKGFAEVHHKNPLAERSSPSQTKLSELAVVCANCHKMIHRGGACRALEALRPNSWSTS